MLEIYFGNSVAELAQFGVDKTFPLVSRRRKMFESQTENPERLRLPKLFQTLRFRLTLWNTIVVLIAALLALIAVREAMRLTIENEARSMLREEAIELELAIHQLSPDQKRIDDEFERKVLGHSQHAWFAALLNENGSPIWKSENLSPDALEETIRLVEQNLQPEFSYQRTDHQMTVTHSMALSDQVRRFIVIGEPTEFIRNDVWQLTKTLLYIGAALLIVAPVGGFLLARRVTSPVREIIATTRSLNPAQLQSRLPIRGTGDELDQISNEINSFVDQISRYIKSQREFVANAAHELRSPITAIQTSVEVTLDKPRTPDEYREELETVSEQCQQLRHLVNQLLELAETDVANQAASFQSVNLTDLIEKSLNVFSGVAEEKEIDVEPKLEANVEIPGDATKLRQVINNLLDNALKFSPVGGHVGIELSQNSGEIVWQVNDSGLGVPDADLEQIFDRFFQVDKARQRDSNRGNGLGLSICKSIVELHGGKIIARNTSDGFAVEVRIPTG